MNSDPHSSTSSHLTYADHSTHAVGVSAAWRKLLMQVETAIPHIRVALLEGEPGVGKHHFARYLWSHSSLAKSTFQRCDAREWLLEDTDPAKLIGFTYLDRVDLLAPPGQRLLLSALKSLQDRSNRAVLLASSQVSLRQMSEHGQFLPDLAYRLTAVRFAIPPLRQRREDITVLAQHLLNHFRVRYQFRTVSLGPGVLARLLHHDWPGNIRELASVLEAALLESSDGVIQLNNLFLANSNHVPTATPHRVMRAGDLSLDAVIRHHVHHVLDLNRGNKLRAARQLGISRSTLYRILGSESILAHSGHL